MAVVATVVMAISFAQKAVAATVAIVILILAKGSSARSNNSHFDFDKRQ